MVSQWFDRGNWKDGQGMQSRVEDKGKSRSSNPIRPPQHFTPSQQQVVPVVNETTLTSRTSKDAITKDQILASKHVIKIRSSRDSK